MPIASRAVFAGLLALLMTCGTAGIAAAANAPAPQISPPPQCFVEKDGALPLCTQESDGTWSVTYPTGGGNLDDGTSSNNTKHTVGIVIVVVCVLGILAIAVWQWVLPRRRDRQLKDTPPTVAGVAATQATVTAYYPDGHTAAVTPPPRAPVLPPEAFAPPAAPPAPPNPDTPQQPMVTEAAAAQIVALNTLLEQGQISRAEYDVRRQAIIDAGT
jgi:hypothetical protein